MSIGRRIWRRSMVSVALIFYILVVAGFAYWTYRHERQLLFDRLDQQLMLAATAIKHVLADDFHDRALGPAAITPAEDDQNIEAMSRIADEFGFAFLYTVIEADGKLYLTSSSATLQERADDEEVHYYHHYYDASSKLLAAVGGSEPVYATYTDRWGTFRSLFLPQVSPGGRPYVACAEHELSYVNELLQAKLDESVVIALILLLATLPLFVVYRTIHRRYEREHESARHQLEQDQADHQARAGRLDELAATLQQTQQQLHAVTSELAAARAQLSDQETLFQVITANAADISFILDQYGAVKFVGATVKKVLGYAPDEIIGTHVNTYIHKEDLEALTETVGKAAAQANQTLEFGPLRMRHVADKWLTMEGVITNKLDRPGIHGLVANIHDVSARFQAIKQLRLNHQAIAEMANQHKASATCAQQINSPLTGILASLELLRDHAVSAEETEQMVKEMIAAAAEIRRVVDELQSIEKAKYQAFTTANGGDDASAEQPESAGRQ
ncbi:PAS domain S-box protein [bacterium]|nr:PAS domain S-box protein [bacterium]